MTDDTIILDLTGPSIDYGCKGRYPHEMRVVKEWLNGTDEECLRCSYQNFYPPEPTDQYRKDHIRDTCQPWGETRDIFILCYGYKRYKELNQPRGDKTQPDWDQARKDAQKALRRITR